LDFHENQVREGFVLQFVCAHLDSETEEARHYGIGQMLSEARAPDLRTATALRKEVVGKSGEMREPCALYDSNRKFCAAEKFELGPEPNAVLLFGDLNFRLSAKNIENISQAYFMDSEGRKMLAKNDRLSQYDPRIFGEKHVKKHLDVLVKPAGEKGFGFECNEPFELYPPTYKRKGGKVQLEKEVPFEKNWAENLEDIQSMYGELGTSVFNVTGDPWLGLGVEEEFPLKVKTSPHEACSTMGKAMLTCGGVLQPQCEDWVYELAQHCYVRKDKKKGLNQWAQKKSDLQLGWLDRFCWRSKHADLKEYGVGVRLSTEEGWMDYPGAKDKDGSDHMPVSATFHFTTVKCSCKQDLVGTNLFVPACQAQLDDIEKKALIGGESYRAECETGYALRDGRRTTTLTCGKDGRLQPYTECHKTCAWNEQDWRRFKRPPVLLAGDEIHLTCKDTEDQLLMLLGVPDIKCNKFGGLVPVDLQRIPACVSVCKLLDQEDVVLKEKKLASSDLLAKYGDELKDKGTLLRDVLLEGGTARYACRNGCISVGDTTRQCGEMEKNMAVKCGCNVRLVVKEMTFDDPKLATQIEKVKFQAYGGPLNQEELEDLRGSKGYKAATKFTMEDLNSKEPNENLAIDIPKPANTELHLTLCSKDRLTFWRCSVLASSSAAGSYTVEGLLQFKDSYDGEIKMEIPLEMKVGDKKFARVGLKLGYHLSK